LPDPHKRTVQKEFERAAELFSQRSAGRFDELGAVEFSRVEPGERVVEVAGGTGNFISLVAEVTEDLTIVDLTEGMLQVARKEHPGMKLVVGDGSRLPLRSGSIDLATSAQAFHHIFEPVPVVMEMRRVVGEDGRVLIVDQVTTEKYEEIEALKELEVLRDPSHAASRPPSALRMIVQAGGLDIVDEKIHVDEQRLSSWMWPVEFPPERIDAVRDWIERWGHKTGKEFRREGDDWAFTRHRIMILAARPA
jgi:ubiquinone/menaquinone biosynthesis C-methylase UbiE